MKKKKITMTITKEDVGFSAHTLVELRSLPTYDRNEGTSLVPLINGRDKNREHVALTTYGRNNHSVRTKYMRYIRYEDGTEELYDHRRYPNEWTNLAGEKRYRKTIAQLRQYLPQVNIPWTEHSAYNFQPYFREQKARD